jgi:hypothetical protein
MDCRIVPPLSLVELAQVIWSENVGLHDLSEVTAPSYITATSGNVMQITARMKRTQLIQGIAEA